MVNSNGFVFHPTIKLLTERLESKGFSVIVTGWGRTAKQQIDEYKKKAKDQGVPFDLDIVPLNSFHLPCFETMKLRAIDFHLEKDGKRVGWVELEVIVKETLREMDILFYGLCTSKIGHWCHFDTRNWLWVSYYNY